MFAIYGTSGPIYQGTLENLPRITPVARSGPVIAARRVGDQIEEVALPSDSGATEASAFGGQAVEAYKAMLPQNIERGPLYHASQIMQTTVIRVSADDSVTHAWRTLRDHAIHQAPVLDDDGRLVGIVSERDLLTAINVDGGSSPVV